MLRIKARGLGLSVAFALVAALAFTAGSVFVASGSGEQNVFYACLTRWGALSNVSLNPAETPTCRSSQTLVHWNVDGPQGIPGTNGVSVTSADAETLPAGSAATANFDPAAGALHLGIPQGEQGPQGAQGVGSAVCVNCVFSGDDLAGMNLSHSVFTGSHFTTSGSNDPAIDLSNTSFVDAKMRDVVIGDIVAVGTDFSGANLSDAMFNSFGYTHGRVTGVLFTNTDLSGAVFNYSSNLAGIDLSTANVSGVSWLSTVICPDGTNASSHPDPSSPSRYTCEGHLSPTP